MSLVNDALRRAREAQRQTPPPPSPQMQFRPVEPTQQPPRNLGLIVPAALALVALLALLFIWQWTQRRTAMGPQEVRALTSPAVPPPIAPQPTTPPPQPEVLAAAAQPSSPSQPFPQSEADTNVAKPLALPTPTAPPNPPVVKEQENDANTSVTVAPPPEPKWPPLKLQAIVFDPKRPSVLINGASLFVGEKLGDLRVVAIDRGSATLESAGRTKILSMP
jgi:hypothetical protein